MRFIDKIGIKKYNFKGTTYYDRDCLGEFDKLPTDDEARLDWARKEIQKYEKST